MYFIYKFFNRFKEFVIREINMLYIFCTFVYALNIVVL